MPLFHHYLVLEPVQMGGNIDHFSPFVTRIVPSDTMIDHSQGVGFQDMLKGKYTLLTQDLEESS